VASDWWPVASSNAGRLCHNEASRDERGFNRVLLNSYWLLAADFAASRTGFYHLHSSYGKHL